MAHRVDDLLLPVVKGVGSERAYEILTESLQTLGGSGFLQDYPIEQYIRDAKIDSLYEGTTAIQAMDFFFRKIVRDRGEALAHVASQISSTIDTCDASAEAAGRPAAHRARRCPGDDGHGDRLPDGGVRETHGDLQGRAGVGAIPARRRGPAHRLATTGAGPRRARALAGDSSASGRGLLPRQDRDCGVLRRQHAAEAHRRARIIEDIDDDVMQLPEAAF